jgi:hypothetical protein
MREAPWRPPLRPSVPPSVCLVVCLSVCLSVLASRGEEVDEGPGISLPAGLGDYLEPAGAVIAEHAAQQQRERLLQEAPQIVPAF